MKKLLFLLPALLLGCCLLSSCDNKLTKTSASTPTKLVIGLDDNFPPMGFRDEKNQLIGFDIDMAREVSQRIGIDAEFKPIDWNSKEAELISERVDLLWNGLTITPSRLQKINFTKPYMENHQIIVVKSGSQVKNKADLVDKNVGVQNGSSAVDAILADKATMDTFKSLKRYGDNVTALMDLSAGRIDAVVLDEVVGRYYLNKRPNEYIILSDNFGTEEYGVGIRKTDNDLLVKVQKAMDDMRSDGTSGKIAQKWFGKDIIK